MSAQFRKGVVLVFLAAAAGGVALRSHKNWLCKKFNGVQIVIQHAFRLRRLGCVLAPTKAEVLAEKALRENSCLKKPPTVQGEVERWVAA